jgi:hypothetical protein
VSTSSDSRDAESRTSASSWSSPPSSGGHGSRRVPPTPIQAPTSPRGTSPGPVYLPREGRTASISCRIPSPEPFRPRPFPIGCGHPVSPPLSHVGAVSCKRHCGKRQSHLRLPSSGQTPKSTQKRSCPEAFAPHREYQMCPLQVLELHVLLHLRGGGIRGPAAACKGGVLCRAQSGSGASSRQTGESTLEGRSEDGAGEALALAPRNGAKSTRRRSRERNRLKTLIALNLLAMTQTWFERLSAREPREGRPPNQQPAKQRTTISSESRCRRTSCSKACGIHRNSEWLSLPGREK